MEGKLIIYSKSGSVIAQVDKWEFTDTYMGEQCITFDINSPAQIPWSVGCYCVYRGETYTLNYIPTTTQTSRRRESGNAFKYDSVKFDSAREELTRIIMLDVTASTGDYVSSLGTNYTGSSQFSLYCGETVVDKQVRTAVCVLCGKIYANLIRLNTGWHFNVDLTSTHKVNGVDILNTHTDDKVLTFDNTTVQAALEMIHSEFNLDYCVKGRTIYVGYSLDQLTGDGKDFFYFGYGRGMASKDEQGKSLYEIKKSSDSNQKIVTRLRALGSTRNMPYRYYNKKFDLSQALFPQNLQLPGTFLPLGTESDSGKDTKWGKNNGRKDAEGYSYCAAVLGDTNDAYIDKNNNASSTDEGIREDSARWDGSNSELEEIYPTIKEMTYGELRKAGVHDILDIVPSGESDMNAYRNYGNTERVDEILSFDELTNYGDGLLAESQGDVQTQIPVVLTADMQKDRMEQPDAWDTDRKELKAKVTIGTIENVAEGNYELAPAVGNVVFECKVGNKQTSKAAIMTVGLRVYITDEHDNSLLVDKNGNILPYFDDKTLRITSRNTDFMAQEFAALPDAKEGGDAKVQHIHVSQRGKVFIKVTPYYTSNSDESTAVLTWRVGLTDEQRKTADPRVVSRFLWGPEDSATTYMNTPFYLFIKDFGVQEMQACFNTSDTPVITMTSGRCTGREFKIESDIPEKVVINGKNCWKVRCSRVEDSALKTYYPSEVDPIAVGDNYVLLNVSMPDSYVEAAEERLLVAATQYLNDNCNTKFTYEPSLDDIYLQREYDKWEEAGAPEKSIYWKLYAGLKFPFYGIPDEGQEAYDVLVNITIQKVTIKEGDGVTPKVELTLNDDVQQSTIQKITSAIDRIYNGSLFGSGEGGSSIDIAAVRNQISQYGSSLFLSKTKTDSAKEKITFEQGANFGKYVSGPDGYGANINNDGNAEFRNIRAWESLTVSELRFDRATVLLGTNIQTYTGGVVGRVEPINDVSGYIDLQTSDGESVGTIQNGALCVGYFHNADGGNAVADSDDFQGDIQYKGTTCCKFALDWNEEDAPNTNTTKHIRYELKPGTTVHPVVGMTFKGVGNMKHPDLGFFAISTPKYTAKYAFVTSWIWVAKQNIVEVSGSDISGFGALAGESWTSPKPGTICTSLYTKGTIHQIDNDKRYLYITQSSNGMLMLGETERITLAVRDTYFRDVSDEFSFTFNGKPVDKNAGGEYVAEISFDDLPDDINYIEVTAIDKNYNGRFNLSQTITERKLILDYHLEVLSSALSSSNMVDDEFQFNDGSTVDSDDGQVIATATVGDSIRAIRMVGTFPSTYGYLFYILDNGQKNAYTDDTKLVVPASASTISFLWTKDESATEILSYKTIPVVSTKSFFAIYHDGDERPELPVYGEDIAEKGWYQKQGRNTVWMSAKTATSIYEGTWGEAVKIVGTNGTTVRPLGTVPTEAQLPADAKDYDAWIVTTNLKDEHGHLFVFYGGSWTDVGVFQGEPGMPAYVHIKYSHDGVTFSENNGETPAEYIGILTDHTQADSNVFSDYTWKRIVGDSFILQVNKVAANISNGLDMDYEFDNGENMAFDDDAVVDYLGVGDKVACRRMLNGKLTDVGNLYYSFGNDAPSAETKIDNDEPITIVDTKSFNFWWYRDDAFGELLQYVSVPIVRNGVSSVTSFVFKRQNTKPDAPVTGNYYEIVPTSEGWSDGIPAGEEIVWMSKRVFFSDDTPTTWSEPQQMTDTADFDVEYSTALEYTEIPESVHGINTDKSPWGWQNTPSPEIIWMATSRMNNGVWSKWCYTRVKGEDGQDGNDGLDGDDGADSFVSMVFQRAISKPSAPSGGSYASPVPAGWSDGIPEGDHQVWMSKRVFFSDNRITPDWSEPKPLTDTADFDICYHSATDDGSVPALPTEHHTEDQGNGWHNTANNDDVWMATAQCTNGVWKAWQVNKIKGEDGRSYVGTGEFYYASKTDDITTLPSHTVESHNDWKGTLSDLVNKYSDEYPYLWNFEIVETKDSKGNSIKTATTPEMISFYGKDGSDGKSVAGIDERYLATVDEKKPAVDPVTCKENSAETDFSADYPFLWNNQRVIFDTNPVTYGSWSGWQQISHWGADAELFEVRPYKAVADNSGHLEDIEFDSGDSMAFDDGIVVASIEEGAVISASRFYNGEESTLGSLFYQIDSNPEVMMSNGSPIKIGTGTKVVKFMWIDADNNEITSIQVPVITSGISSFVSMVFKRKNVQPDTPTQGSYIEPVPTSEGWSDGIPDGDALIWMSKRIFYSDNRDTTWSTPSQMNDTADFDVEYSSVDNPAPPSGHPNTNRQWSNSADSTTIWMATSRMSNNVWGAWQVSKIKGEKGKDGNDGKSAYEIWLEQPGNAGKSEAEYLESLRGAAVSRVVEWYGVSNDEKTRPTTWYSEYMPDVSEENRYLWNYEETYDTNGKKIATTTPVIILMWSQDGRGIKSIIEYYALSKTKDIVPASWRTDVPTMDAENRYLWNKETINYTEGPSTTTEPAIIGVYGDKGKDGDSAYDIWVKQGHEGKSETEFIESLQGKPGETGQGVFTSYVFKRSETTPSRPVGGSYTSPLPDYSKTESQGWSDGVPEGSSPVYMSSRVFTSDGNNPAQSQWTAPKLLADTESLDYEYSAVENNPGNPTSNPSNWHDNATPADMWMALRKKVAGHWSSWQINKIKGEDGTDGLNAAQPNLMDQTDSNKFGLGSWVSNGSGNVLTLTDELYGDMKVIKAIGHDGAVYRPYIAGNSYPKYFLPLKPDTIYTFSVYVKLEVPTAPWGTVSLHVLADEERDAGHYTTIKSDTIISQANEWKRCIWTFRTSNSPYQLYAGLFIYTGNTALDGKGMYFCMPKLEEGEVATPWCLSENDKIGADGESPITMQLSTPLVAFSTIEGKVASGSVARDISVTLYRGTQPLTITSLTTNYSASTPFAVSKPNNSTIRVTPVADAAWNGDKLINITASATVDGVTISRTASLNVVGSAQGQTVTGPQGSSISKVEEYYMATNTVNEEGSPVAPKADEGTWSSEYITPTASFPYVWNKEIIFVKDPVTQSESVLSTDVHLYSIFSDGLMGHISDYVATTSRNQPDANGTVWMSLDEAMRRFSADRRYLWNREIVTYKDSNNDTTSVRLIAVWGEKGTNGQSVFTSYVFKRNANGTPARPEGGTFLEPNRVSGDWSDGVPAGSDPVYMSSRIFTSDGKAPQESAWSIPSLMADTADIDICYNASESHPGTPPNTHPVQTGAWHDIATEDDIWMAISKKVGGTWSDWQVTRIKGETGEQGRPGTDIDIKGTAVKYFETYGEYNSARKVSGLYLVFGRQFMTSSQPGAYLYEYDGVRTNIIEPEKGDTYVSDENGHLYVVSSNVDDPEPTETFWTDAGVIRGDSALTIIMSQDAVVAKKKASSQTFTVYLDVMLGKDVVAPGTGTDNTYSFSVPTGLPSGLTVQAGATGARGYYKFTLNANAIVNTDISIEITHFSNKHTKIINFRTVDDGERGPQGQAGPMPVPRGEWNENESYTYNDSIREIVIYQTKLYAVKTKGTTCTGSDVPGVSTKWEEANKFNFVATDLLLTDAIYAKVLSAVQAQIDELVVGRLQTMATGGSSLQIENGLMTVFGATNIKNIEFGVNDEGYAVLNYFDNAGNLLYNLGPQGIMSQVSVIYARYVLMDIKRSNATNMSSYVINAISNKASDVSKVYYQWTQGVKTVGNANNYTAFEAKAANEVWQTNPFAYTGCITESKLTNLAPASIIADGVFLHKRIQRYDPYSPGHGQASVIYDNQMWMIQGGKVTKSFIIYTREDASGRSIIDHLGREYPNPTTTSIEQYLADTNQ